MKTAIRVIVPVTLACDRLRCPEHRRKITGNRAGRARGPYGVTPLEISENLPRTFRTYLLDGGITHGAMKNLAWRDGGRPEALRQ
jgi:hypothetical protein